MNCISLCPCFHNYKCTRNVISVPAWCPKYPITEVKLPPLYNKKRNFLFHTFKLRCANRKSPILSQNTYLNPGIGTWYIIIDMNKYHCESRSCDVWNSKNRTTHSNRLEHSFCYQRYWAGTVTDAKSIRQEGGKQQREPTIISYYSIYWKWRKISTTIKATYKLANQKNV